MLGRKARQGQSDRRQTKHISQGKNELDNTYDCKGDPAGKKIDIEERYTKVKKKKVDFLFLFSFHPLLFFFF